MTAAAAPRGRMRGIPGSEAPVTALRARAYTIPTDRPEADGTFAWSSTTLVVVEVDGGGQTGLGYSYTAAAARTLATDLLFEAIRSYDACDPPAAWRAMNVAARNIGRDGLAAAAISAVDTALWDLKAKLCGWPSAALFGRFRHAVPIYGSGGFTSYSDTELRERSPAGSNVTAALS